MVKENPNNLFEVNSLLYKLQDSCNQIYQFRFLPTFVAIQKAISEMEFKTLQEITGETEKILDSKYPKVCSKYNSLIKELKKGKFTPERLEKIFLEAWEITHPK